MKLKIDTCVKKMDGPARAIINVEVTELDQNESFDQNTVDSISSGIYLKEFAFFLKHADFFGHQTFMTEMHFTHKNQELISRIFPCYTDNY